MNLLTYGNSVFKIRKSNKAGLGYESAILYLAPFNSSGIGNVCPNASTGCISSCLFTAGYGAYSTVRAGRIRKTKMWYENRDEFLQLLNKDIAFFIRRCTKRQLTPAIRLNGTSDIPWQKHLDMEQYPQVQFYDYTKSYSRMLQYLKGEDWPSNYHLTFSRSERNEEQAIEIRRMGGNVAVVFKPHIPEKWKRFKVFSGDSHDLRFLDKPGICGLTAKGKAKKDTTNFVVRL